MPREFTTGRPEGRAGTPVVFPPASSTLSAPGGSFMSFPLLSSHAPRRSRAALPGLLLLGVSLLTLVGGAQPARAARTPPPPTSSRYMSTTDPATARLGGHRLNKCR